MSNPLVHTDQEVQDIFNPNVLPSSTSEVVLEASQEYSTSLMLYFYLSHNSIDEISPTKSPRTTTSIQEGFPQPEYGYSIIMQQTYCHHFVVF